jgi:anti-anti-sigma factor
MRLHSVEDVVVVELIIPGLSEGPLLEEVSDRLHEAIGRSMTKRMIVDFSRVRFIASRTLAVLVSLNQIIECHKGQFAICGLRHQVEQVFRFAGLDRVFTFHRTREDAISSLGVHAA